MAYGCVGLIAYVVVLSFANHVWPRRNPGTRAVLGAWVVVLAFVVVAVLVTQPAGLLDTLAVNVAFYLFSVEVFVFVYTAVSASVSIRLLVAMRSHTREHDAFAHAVRRYAPAVLFEHRVQRLVEQDLLAKTNEHLVATRRGRRWAAGAVLLKRFLAVGYGG